MRCLTLLTSVLVGVLSLCNGTRLTNYIEGNGSVIVDRELTIGPIGTIESVLIQLLGEDSKEYIDVDVDNDLFSIEFFEQTTILINGTENASQYDNILQSLSYLHNDSNPGNPTEGIRSIVLTIDNDGEIELNFTVTPVNDPPILSFGDCLAASDEGKIRQYSVEDNQMLHLTSDIHLCDVDSQIRDVIIELSSEEYYDSFQFNKDLFMNYKISVTEEDATLTLSGIASAVAYEKILRSFSFVVMEEIIDNVTVSIIAIDEQGIESDSVDIYIDILTSNNETSEDTLNNETIVDTLQFTEGSTSIAIATPILLELIREENDDISELTVVLDAINGDLDDGDKLFLHTDQQYNTEENTSLSLIISSLESLDEYINFLQSIRYINEEDEPTYFTSNGADELTRQVVIQVTSNGTPLSQTTYRLLINMTLINDGKPIISIALFDEGCLATYPVNQSLQHSKRDVYSSSRLLKLLQKKRRSTNTVKEAPSMEVAYAELPSEEVMCFSSIAVQFSVDTNTPPVEVKRDLSELVSLLPPGLNSRVTHGKWVNYKTLVVSLAECYWNYNTFDLKIVLKTPKGEYDCNKTSSCTEGICFRNSTGCPAIGYSSILTNFTASTEDQSFDPSASTEFSLLPYIGIIVTIVIIIVAFTCAVKIIMKEEERKTSANTKSLDESASGEIHTLLPQNDKAVYVNMSSASNIQQSKYFDKKESDDARIQDKIYSLEHFTVLAK